MNEIFKSLLYIKQITFIYIRGKQANLLNLCVDQETV